MSSDSFGVISPHPPIFIPAVGGARAHVTDASLLALSTAGAAIARFAPDLIVLMSPHAPAYAEAIAVDTAARYEGDLGQFGDHAPYGRAGEPHFAGALLERLAAADIPAIARSEHPQLRSGWLDHATIVPLHFLDPDKRFPLVVLSLSYLPYESHRALGTAVRETAADLGIRVAFVASGDMSHRLTHDAPAGFSPRAHELDEAILSAVREGEFKGLMHIDPVVVDEGGECGLRSFVALGGFLGEDPQPTRVLAYEGPWGVGYLTALAGEAAVSTYDALPHPTEQQGAKGGSAGADSSEIVSLAREAIETWVRDRKRIEPAPLADPAYPARAGVFVCLDSHGDLRGCIGTIGACHPSLAEEVVANAIEASTRDPRFPQVEVDELSHLELKVDVLHEPEDASFEDLDSKHYGVIVTSGARRGLLLPDLEGVDDAETQVAIAMRKAGISAGDPISLQRFKVDRYT